MSPQKKFANPNNLKRKGFSPFPPILRLLTEGYIAGVVFCVLIVAVMHMMLGLWVLALVFGLVCAAFAHGLRLFHRFAWGR